MEILIKHIIPFIFLCFAFLLIEIKSYKQTIGVVFLIISSMLYSKSRDIEKLVVCEINLQEVVSLYNEKLDESIQIFERKIIND